MAHWSKTQREAAARIFARALPILPPPKPPPPLKIIQRDPWWPITENKSAKLNSISWHLLPLERDLTEHSSPLDIDSYDDDDDEVCLIMTEQSQTQ